MKRTDFFNQTIEDKGLDPEGKATGGGGGGGTKSRRLLPSGESRERGESMRGGYNPPLS